MVDLLKVTNFHRSQAELEEFWLVAICVAGKNGPLQAQKVHEFLQKTKGKTPFEKIRNLKKSGQLQKHLRDVKMGQYKRIKKAFSHSLLLNLKTCSLDDLVKIPGVGNKTARFFLLHSRLGCNHVVLDTHILRFLREECGLKNIPYSTPSNVQKYVLLENKAREVFTKKFPRHSFADADLKIWLKMSGRRLN